MDCNEQLPSFFGFGNSHKFPFNDCQIAFLKQNLVLNSMFY